LGGSKKERWEFESEKEYQKDREIWQKQHDEVIALGGLRVIGSERHESRRIDNQLRGRSGRQGDPGSSRFYVSLEDDIMRLFGGDQVSKLMSVFKLPEDVPLEHPMVSRAIQQAQVKVEGFHFDSRKHLVEYDDVLNKQREIIYQKRRAILEGESQKESVLKKIQTLYKSDVVVYGGRGKSGKLMDVIPAQITYLNKAQEITKLYVGSLPGVTWEEKKKNVNYADLTKEFEKTFPTYTLSYMITYGSYGLVNSL
jgi:preprotein translocase subunit SecA